MPAERAGSWRLGPRSVTGAQCGASSDRCREGRSKGGSDANDACSGFPSQCVGTNSSVGATPCDSSWPSWTTREGQRHFSGAVGGVGESSGRPGALGSPGRGHELGDVGQGTCGGSGAGAGVGLGAALPRRGREKADAAHRGGPAGPFRESALAPHADRGAWRALPIGRRHPRLADGSATVARHRCATLRHNAGEVHGLGP
jgi:hypothetical protein